MTGDAGPRVEIAWDALDLGEWTGLLDRAPHLPLTQSWAYAEAMSVYARRRFSFGVIRAEGHPIGLVMALRGRGLGRLVRRVGIERGPVWLSPKIGPGLEIAAYRALRASFPRSFRLWTGFLFEGEDTERRRALLKAAGFRRKHGPGYRTILLDLTPGLALLRTSLDGKWRNALARAERAQTSGDLVVTEHRTADGLGPLLDAYNRDKNARGYPGPTERLARYLAMTCAKAGGLYAYTAEAEGGLAGGVIVLRQGRTATYQIGFASDVGRKTNVTRLLLWRAIQALAADRTPTLDLGGISDDAPGLATFKRGLAGREIELVGMWG